MGLLHLVNRQRACRIDLRLLRRALGEPGLLPDEDFDLSIAFVGAREMARLNQRHVGHSGPTDVITLDYSGGGGELIAEIFICPAVARQQAREFRTAWQSELARY